MEIKVKKEKEPELKLKKEAQVTVHKKNNWRKMHGLPMRRKQKARKKHERGKRADSH